MATSAAIIVAAGSGTRLGGPLPKQFQKIGGEMVLTRSLRGALAAPGVEHVLVAIAADALSLYREAVTGIDDRRLLPPCTGGAERAETVHRALETLAASGPAPDIVLVHDAARPFASAGLWMRITETALESGEGVIAAEPVVDALWREQEGHAEEPVPRAGLWRAQTPQAFPFTALLSAHRLAVGSAADDAEVYRRAGGRVRLVAGEPENFKITTPADLERARRMVAVEEAMKRETRVGQGFDVHRFGAGDHVMLCGVAVPHTRGLTGHSDADVGIHALCDAIYGALGEGDIGRHFPPSETRWKGAASEVFLRHAVERVHAHGGRIINVDVTLLCEAPKIAPHAEAMRGRIADILGVEPARVSVKATTMERMGFIGRGEGIGALASACLSVPCAAGDTPAGEP